jgi:hypothetical protein
MNDSFSPSSPITRHLKPANILSLIAALLMAVVSAAGLIFSARLYPTDTLLTTYLTNDVINLFIGLPILFGSMWLARGDKLIGLLFWPGALLYTFYNYIAYLVGVPYGIVSVAYLLLVLLSALAIFDLLKRIDKVAVQKRLIGMVPVKFAGWVLVGFGVLFFVRAIGVFAEARANQNMLPLSEIGVLIADVIISMAWVAGGAMLLRRQPWGFVCALGLLFGASMLFVGLIVFLLLQPSLTSAPFAWVDVMVVFIMGLVCFIPTGLYIRGVVSEPKN